MDRTVEVEGMDCPGCANRLGTALDCLDGVVEAKADHQAGRVKVRFDPDRVSEDRIRERIRSAGFVAREEA
jgi:copper chaperone CopZ